MSRQPLCSGSEGPDLPWPPGKAVPESTVEDLAEHSLRAYVEARAARSRGESSPVLARPTGSDKLTILQRPAPPDPLSGHTDAVIPQNAAPTTVGALQQIPECCVNPPRRTVFFSDPQGPGADRFRLLRMRLTEIRKEKAVKIVVITSPLPDDGKTTVALNLATALAERHKQTVLLIDADMHRSSICNQLRLDAGRGLSDCLTGEASPLSIIRRLEPLGWYFLSAGSPSNNPTELLQKQRLDEMMKSIGPHFDWILIDSPPVVSVTDTLLLTKQADASLLVVREDHTPREALAESLALIGPKHVLGIVFNASRDVGHHYGRYGYYYSKKKNEAMD